MRNKLLIVLSLTCLFLSGMAGAFAQTPPSGQLHSTPVARPARPTASKVRINLRAGKFVKNHLVLNTFVPKNGYHSGEPIVVVVDKGSHRTHLYQLQRDHVFLIYTAANAIGKDDTPTQSGRYLVAMKKLDPSWIPPPSIHHDPVQPYSKDHENPLGVAAIFLNSPGLLLHGTNAPGQLRQNVSHGCIRHSNLDIMRIYSMVKLRTPVYIVQHMRGTVLNLSDFKKPGRSKTRK